MVPVSRQRSSKWHGSRKDTEDLDSERKVTAEGMRRERERETGSLNEKWVQIEAGGQRKQERKSKRRREIEEWVGGRTNEKSIQPGHTHLNHEINRIIQCLCIERTRGWIKWQGLIHEKANRPHGRQPLKWPLPPDIHILCNPLPLVVGST